MNDREQFEAWCKSGNINTDSIRGTYVWEGWQACAESKKSELDKANADVEKYLSAYKLAHVQAMGNGEAYDTARAELDKANARITQLEEALHKLATLGNGYVYGNSVGNVIAQEALATPSDTWLSENNNAVEAGILEEVLGLSNDLSNSRGDIYSGDFRSLLVSMITTRKSKLEDKGV